MPFLSLRTQVGLRPTVVPSLREARGWGERGLTLRTQLDARPAARLLDLSPRDAASVAERGFPVDREIAQPREWVGRVQGPEDDGWWLLLGEVPGGMELSAWVEASTFRDVVPSAGLPVLVRTWLEWADGLQGRGTWRLRQVVTPNRGA